MASAQREALIEALEAWGVDRADIADDHASLLGSGVLDSLALFNLSLWLEQQLGEPIDPTSFDVAREWDSVASILAFMARRRGEAIAAPLEPVPPTETTAPAAPAPPQPVVAEAYRIERFRIEHLRAVGRLLCELWSPDAALNESLFRWKYLDNPFDPDPLVYVALRDGEVVAVRAFCAWPWTFGEGGVARTDLHVADDFVVRDEDRNHGLMARFTDVAAPSLLERGAQSFVSLSALRVTRLQLLASGSRSLGVLPTVALRPAWVRALDRTSDALKKLPLLWRAADRIAEGEPAQRAFERLDAQAAALPLSCGSSLSFSAAPDADELAALVAGLPSIDGRWRLRRDRNYFSWRFANPLHAYRFLMLRADDGRLRGFATIQRGLSAYADQRRVNIVDWAVREPADWSDIIAGTQRLARMADLVTWRNASAAIDAEIDACGFTPADAHQAQRGLPCVLCRDLVSSPSLPLPSLAQWDLRMAYTSFA